ncbi:hydroxyacylglutathione hydrolase [Pseudoalteromonas luteoviolacea]|uniref:hydroxyacylglutathione hydrolase n=1 Tax=Pseudoalteromonas luteoviolacea TaxID=43657 RepID=UPI001EED4AE8|nr:hydroxyacylglutathione hydrolase [Pseudoalteromonas luteoviolacea]MCF6441927.1 hydroxyacylglutathione hydrolase [Pseudoalteromonas luteoviolacea]
MAQVEPIKAFTDNYIWAICNQHDNATWVVDPGQSQPVLTFLNKNNRTLSGVLITHHHWDHTDGVAELLLQFPNIPVYGPKDSKYDGITHPLTQDDKITIAGIPFKVVQTPGHTLDHICYINDDLALTGDTLFSGGCGRLFEGTAEQMWYSLESLKQLPDTCQIYCTHEYTLANLAFAHAVEPENKALSDYIKWCQLQRAKDLPTLPTNMGNERAVNPFLRSDQADILAHLPAFLQSTPDILWQRFALLRQWKDNF